MNIADIINHAYDLIGNDLKFCAGNSHMVSRVAAGMAFVDRKVILMGRNPYPPDKSRKHVFVEGVNVCNLLRDTGKLVLWNEGQKNFQIEDLIQLIETSNMGLCPMTPQAL